MACNDLRNILREFRKAFTRSVSDGLIRQSVAYASGSYPNSKC